MAKKHEDVENEVMLHRDKDSHRWILDLVLSGQEEQTICEALRMMEDFEYNVVDELECDYSFNPNPSIHQDIANKPRKALCTAAIFGVTFSQGINEMQTLAIYSSASDVQRQVDINNESFDRLELYYEKYMKALKHQIEFRESALVQKIRNDLSEANWSSENGQLSLEDEIEKKKIECNERVISTKKKLMREVMAAKKLNNQNSLNKNVDILLSLSEISRVMCGTNAILCKSGKDRTSMASTLENSKDISERLGVMYGEDICETFRMQGCRRMNVYANTGQSFYAFNKLQIKTFPTCYKPPDNSHSKNVNS